LDTDIPVVFWGVNSSPLKYGLIDSIEHPGHNVTGVYQTTYYQENLEHLLKLVPGVKRVAVLSDDSPTGRSHVKMFQNTINNGALPIKLVESVVTNSFEQWKKDALRLLPLVDAFMISNHHTLKDEQDNPVSEDDVLSWYLKNMNKPEIVAPISFVKNGMLASINDSPYKQGYEAAKIANDILSNGKDPKNIPPYAPEHGGFIVNTWRAKQLGLENNVLKLESIINQKIDEHISFKP